MIRIAIIDDQAERSNRLEENLLAKDFPEVVRIHQYNSIDTFTTDAYKHSNLNFLIINMSLQMGIPAKEGIFILKKMPTLDNCQFILLRDSESRRNLPFNLIDVMIGAINIYVKKNRDRTLANRIANIILHENKIPHTFNDNDPIPLHESDMSQEISEMLPFGETESMLASELLFNSTIDIQHLSNKFNLSDSKIISTLLSLKLKADHLHYSIQTLHINKQNYG
ncbi:MAG: hypothetical protein V4590_01725 [Bacteroidota bacterium]